MNRTSLFRLSSFIILFLILAACQRSAQPTQPLFSNAQLTSIASTAQAGSLQTQAAYTPTPIPPTSTPKVSAISGSSLALREDGTTLFTDHKAGAQIIVPAGWLPIRVNEEEYYKAFALDVVASNQIIVDRLTQIQKNDINVFRLEVIDIRPQSISNNKMSLFSVIFREGDTHTLEEWLKAERGQKKPYTGYKFLSSQYRQTTNDYRTLVVDESWTSTQLGTTYYHSMFFSIPTGALIFDFQSNLDDKKAALSDFEQVVDSLTLLNPK